MLLTLLLVTGVIIWSGLAHRRGPTARQTFRLAERYEAEKKHQEAYKLYRVVLETAENPDLKRQARRSIQRLLNESGITVPEVLGAEAPGDGKDDPGAP